MPPRPSVAQWPTAAGAPLAGLAQLGGRGVVRADIEVDEHGAALVGAAAVRALAVARPLLFVLHGGTRGVDRVDRPMVESVTTLGAIGRAARALASTSGRVPTVAILDGPLLGGAALLAGLVDVVITTPAATAFVTGPRAIRHTTAQRVTASQLGGAQTLATRSGTTTVAADDLDDALAAAAQVLAHLPDHVDAPPPRLPTSDPADRDAAALRTALPPTANESYDVRDLLAMVVDDGVICEVREAWAPNLVTAFAAIGARPVGVVANQPRSLAGTLDIAASQKGARFVTMCDAFGLGLVTFVDTPGFYPGKDQEWRGMIRHGAQLAFAYGRASVPRISVTLRKSYGGAYIVMDSRWLGCDLALAWPTAEIAVMGAKGAAEILHRRATPDERAAAAEAYEAHHLNPWRAAERGLIDAVIDPATTRREVAAALDLLASAREHLPPRAHDNTPL